MADVNPNFDLKEADRRHYMAMTMASAALLDSLRSHHPRIVANLTRKQTEQQEQTT